MNNEDVYYENLREQYYDKEENQFELLYEQEKEKNEILKSNWNELIKNIKEAYKHTYSDEVQFVLDGILDDMYKMQEIEGEKNV